MAGEHGHEGHHGHARHQGHAGKPGFAKDFSDVSWEEVYARQSQRAPLAEDYWRLAGGRPGLRLADVGCGPGFFTLRLASLTGPTGHVHAVDASVDALASLRARLDPVHHANVTTEVLDVEAAPLPELGFDAVLVTDMLHHADDVDAALRNLRATRAPIVIAEFDPDAPGDIGPPVEMRMRPEALTAALRRAGWRPGPPQALGHEHYAVLAR